MSTKAMRTPEGGRPRVRYWAGLAALVAAAAACGSSATKSSPPAGSAGTAGSSATTAAAPPTVRTATEPRVGTILVSGSGGRAVYLFSPDQQKSVTCTGACATAWPPVIATGAPTAGPGVDASLLGTMMTPSGAMQVTYNHWPLYTFIQDTGPNQVHGQGVVAFGGTWSAVTAEGQMATSSTSSTTASGGGSTGGYGY